MEIKGVKKKRVGNAELVRESERERDRERKREKGVTGLSLSSIVTKA